MRIGEPVGLRVQGREYVGMAVTETGNRGSAGGVDVGSAIGSKISMPLPPLATGSVPWIWR